MEFLKVPTGSCVYDSADYKIKRFIQYCMNMYVHVHLLCRYLHCWRTDEDLHVVLFSSHSRVKVVLKKTPLESETIHQRTN